MFSSSILRLVLTIALVFLECAAFVPKLHAITPIRAVVQLTASLDKSAAELNLEAERLRLQAGQLRLEAEKAELQKTKEIMEKTLGIANGQTEEQVLEAHHRFVDAFTSKSIPKMKKIWSHRHSYTALTHIGKPMVHGIDDICKSFNGAFKGASIDTVNVRDEQIIALSSKVGVVTCTMDIKGKLNDSTSSWVTTNVFSFDDREQCWLLVEHHSSPVLFPVSNSKTE